MRRAVAALVAAMVITAAGTAGGQPFDFPFGRHAIRRVRPTRQPVPARSAVPLPVPRPRFATDKPAAPPAKPAESAAAPALPEAPPLPVPKPADTAKPADAAKPMDTPKPTDTVTAPGTPAAPPAAAPAPLPGVAPSGATTAFTPRQPAADVSCIDRLHAAKVEVESATLGPQPDSRCTVVQPVRLSGLTLPDGGAVAFPDRPTVACATADAFAAYVRDLMAPLAKGSFGAGLSAVWTGPGLECRSRDHIFGAKLSAHGRGLAVDVAQLKLADGRTIEVGTPKTPTDAAFETAARAAGCGYFHTVLGPGSDSYHRTHWHFDLEVRGRKGDDKYCH